MYKYLDKLLEIEKKKVRTEFNHLSVMGFDELNVVNTRKATQDMFDRLLKDNEAMYLKAAKDAYKKAVKKAEEDGFSGEKGEKIGFFAPSNVILRDCDKMIDETTKQPRLPSRFLCL